MLKRAIVKIAGLTGGLLVFVLGLYTLSYFQFHKSDIEVIRFSDLQSPDELHTLTIDVGEPSTPYGPHRVGLEIADASNSLIIREQFRLANDGANIDSGNIVARWSNSDNVVICLRGDEQSDVLVSIQLSNRKVESAVRKCS